MTNILDSFRLDNKIALVTGSAGGMGAAIAIAFAQAGATVATHDVRPPTATTDAIIAAGGKSAAFAADLSDTAAPEALFKQVLAKFGRVDILVNNAGIILREDAVNVPLADWQKVIQINETAVFQLSQLAGRDMISRGAPGKIISTASLLSFQGGIRVPSYAAAKGAVAQITKALANEWAVKTAYRQDAGARPPTSSARPSSSPPPPPTTSPATCWSSTADGWRANHPFSRNSLN
jgi:2-deoxy-D-gluconate 3-dehydrogenase